MPSTTRSSKDAIEAGGDGGGKPYPAVQTVLRSAATSGPKLDKAVEYEHRPAKKARADSSQVVDTGKQLAATTARAAPPVIRIAAVDKPTYHDEDDDDEIKSVFAPMLTPVRSPPRGKYVVCMRNVRLLKNHKLILSDLWVEDGIIIDPMYRFFKSKTHEEFRADLVVDGKGAIVAPGFIDIQINGAYGHDFSKGHLTPEIINDIGRKLFKHGVTSFCPTIVSSSQDTYRSILGKIQSYRGSREVGANCLGLHLEGPFIHPEKKGAHDSKHVSVPKRGFASLLERYGGDLSNVKIITMAPELDGSLDAIKEGSRRGIVMSMGHSIADYDVAVEGFRAGSRMVTHMFNAMPTFHHRDPGLVGLLGTKDAQPFYGLIADGIHTHPASVKIAYLSHPQGAILVTDAIAAMGLPSGKHSLGDQDVDVKGIKAVISGSNTLAGSAVSMDFCVREFRDSTGCSIVEALEAASLHPATALGIQKQKGTLSPGADADLVLLNDKLEVLATFIHGELAYTIDRKATPARKDE